MVSSALCSESCAVSECFVFSHLRPRGSCHMSSKGHSLALSRKSVLRCKFAKKSHHWKNLTNGDLAPCAV